MKQNSTLKSKLAKYSAMASGAIAVSSGANAQVMYTDVNPDEVLTPGGTTQYLVDFNNDATPDIGFVMLSGTATGTFTYSTAVISYTIDYIGGVAAFGTGAASTNAWLGGSYPDALSNGQAIGSAGSFQNGQGDVGVVQSTYLGAPFSTSYGPYTSGEFPGTEAYIGVRFDVSGAVHYGWVRLEMTANGGQLTIKDYAYEATAGTAINAGDMGSVGLEDVNVADKVSIRNQVDFAMINVTPDLIGGTVFVIDMTGQRVAEVNISDINTQVSFEGLAAGIYNISAQFDGGIVTEKVYVR